MPYKLEIKHRATLMIQDAYDWYENAKQGLGESFLTYLDNALSRIVLHPEYYSILTKGYRQIKLSKFPFVVVFETIDDSVVVFAVFHTNRNDQYKIGEKNQ